MFDSPLYILSSILATLWVALFHLIFGRKLSDLVLYWLVGLVGFAVGQAMAEILGFHWLLLGQVHLLEATLACWIAMFVARWLKT